MDRNKILNNYNDILLNLVRLIKDEMEFNDQVVRNSFSVRQSTIYREITKLENELLIEKINALEKSNEA